MRLKITSQVAFACLSLTFIAIISMSYVSYMQHQVANDVSDQQKNSLLQKTLNGKKKELSAQEKKNNSKAAFLRKILTNYTVYHV